MKGWVIINTEKLFYDNCYLSEFTATVTDCREDKGGFAVILDKTAFYPVGGGQPSDTGDIGGVKVLSVYEKDGSIIHITERPVKTGGALLCKVNWQERFALMQEHTGEHIISGLIRQRHGLNNVGFHMGSEFVTIDIDGVISKEDIKEIEREANEAVFKNIPVKAEFIKPENLAEIDFRSKREFFEDVRIVTVNGYDVCACCGIHVGSTGEIGAIKIIDFQKYKKGMRLFVLCGRRAVLDYAKKNESVYDISVALSCKPSEVFAAVNQLLTENSDLKRQLVTLKQQRIMEISKSIAETSETVCLFEDGLSNDELRKLCTLLCEKARIAAVFSINGDVFKYAVGSLHTDVRPICAKLNNEFNGKGGGAAGLVSGSVYGSENDLRSYFVNLDI